MTTFSLVLHGQNPSRIIVPGRYSHAPTGFPIVEDSALSERSLAINWTEVIAGQTYYPLMGNSPEQSVYAHSTFDFMPELLDYLAQHNPHFISQLRIADNYSRTLNRGHGAAVATPYTHCILPLTPIEVRVREIEWGIRYFENFFQRKIEGFWLPEAAVDLSTLSMLKDFGISFVVLSPTQVARVKKEGVWEKVAYSNSEDGKPPFPMINCGTPFKVNTQSGYMNVFLYDAYFAWAFAFTNYLETWTTTDLAQQIYWQKMGGHSPSVIVAVDIETFGHHKKGTCVPLIYHYLNSAAQYDQRIANLGLLLEEAQERPDEIPEIEIINPSSWSCTHGVDHWQANCGCFGNDNGWRGPLRETLNKLAHIADKLFEEVAAKYNKDPEQVRKARIDYIDVLLGKIKFSQFLRDHNFDLSGKNIDELKALQAVFNSLLPRHRMFVSCAWFFEGMGIETGIALSWADHLIRILSPQAPDLKKKFLEALEAIRNTGWRQETQGATGRDVHHKNVEEGQYYWYREWLKGREGKHPLLQV